MNNFKQLIRHENEEMHKERVYKFLRLLEVNKDTEYECVIKPYKSSKSLDQLGYYWTAVISTARDWQGLTVEEADVFLKYQCLPPVYREIMGETYEIRKSIAKMKVDEMRLYIDDCINFLCDHCQAVPPPHNKH